MPVADSATARTAQMMQGFLLIAAVAVAGFNGSRWSPFYDSVAYVLYLATRGYPLATAARMTAVTPVAIAIMTLLIAGIPAALYERIVGLRRSTPVSMSIWLATTLLLSVPTIRNVFGGE
jgi:hypothetical protein